MASRSQQLFTFKMCLNVHKIEIVKIAKMKIASPIQGAIMHYLNSQQTHYAWSTVTLKASVYPRKLISLVGPVGVFCDILYIYTYIHIHIVARVIYALGNVVAPVLASAFMGI